MALLATQTKDSLVTLLGDYANGEYQVIGYESLAKGAKDYEGKNRTVRAFLSEGDFPQSGGSSTSPCQHEVRITLELVCTEASKMDVGTLANPESTDAQRAAALVGATPAAQEADSSLDEFRDLLWEILMAGQNRTLGMPKGKVGSRYVTKWGKDRLVPMGEYVILTGYMTLEFTTKETTTKARNSVSQSYNEIDHTPINGDTAQKTVLRTG